MSERRASLARPFACLPNCRPASTHTQKLITCRHFSNPQTTAQMRNHCMCDSRARCALVRIKTNVFSVFLFAFSTYAGLPTCLFLCTSKIGLFGKHGNFRSCRRPFVVSTVRSPRVELICSLDSNVTHARTIASDKVASHAHTHTRLPHMLACLCQKIIPCVT